MSKPTTDFIGFPKITRFSKDVIVTEKIDGTNAQVYVSDDGQDVYAGSRTRWIEPGDDNFGFAAWVAANVDELRKLGPGSHFGEWWGAGIQRKYGLTEKRFSLFNSERWGDAATRPPCCGVVPILWRGPFDQIPLSEILHKLRTGGSEAAPGFMQPEGVVLFHTASGTLFKKLLENDDVPKGAMAVAA